MNAEYQRLEVQATECWQQLTAQAGSVTVSSAAEAMQREEQILREAMKLASMLFGMILVRSVVDEHAREQDREFAAALPKKFHSQGTRPVSVSLRAGVCVTLDVRYYHRVKDSVRRRHRKAKHGLYPTLLRLGLHQRETPAAVARMARASALLGSFEEAVGSKKTAELEVALSTTVDDRRSNRITYCLDLGTPSSPPVTHARATRVGGHVLIRGLFEHSRSLSTGWVHWKWSA